MKNFKKFAAMVSALALASCAVAPVAMNAFAEGETTTLTTTLTMTVPTSADYTVDSNSIKAVPIFNISRTNNGTAANPNWVMNIDSWAIDNPDTFLTSLNDAIKDATLNGINYDSTSDDTQKASANALATLLGSWQTAANASTATLDTTAQAIQDKIAAYNAAMEADPTQTAVEDATNEEKTTLNTAIATRDAANAAKAEAQAKITKFARVATGLTGGTSGTLEGSTVTWSGAGLINGYYVITCSVTGTDNIRKAKSLGMLTVVDGVTTLVGALESGAPKVALPNVQKKVYEDSATNKADSAEPLGVDEDTQWNDVADYSVGDSVPFKLYGTMPSNLADYETYYYKFSDTLGKEFDMPTTLTIMAGDLTLIATRNPGIPATYDPDDGSVTGAGTPPSWEVKNGDTVFADCVVEDAITFSANGFTVTFSDIKSIPGVTSTSIITVAYNSVLNKNAVVGKGGQINEVELEYSNNPNGTGTGKTKKDEVKVHTYAVRIDKLFFNAANADLTQEEIDNNQYKDVKFTLTSQTDGALKFTKLVEGDAGYGTYDYVVDKNGLVTQLELTKVSDGSDENSVEDLVIRIKGLDEDTYTLKEVAGPGGFNLAPDKFITIKAGTTNTQNWNDFSTDTLGSYKYSIDSDGDIIGSTSDALAQATVENRKGSSLPTTGGIGTTLFYLGGGTMVAVAGVFLITKKRMGKREE